MKILLALCSKELRLLGRDRHGLLVLFAVPALFILLLSLALRNAFDPAAQPRVTLAIEQQDRDTLATQFVAALAAQPGLSLRDDAETRLIVLEGFSELLATRHDFAADYVVSGIEPELLRLDYAPSLMPQARAALAITVRQSLLQVQAEYLFSEVLGYNEAQRAELRYLNDPLRLPITESFRDHEGRNVAAPTAVQHNVPGWLIFAMFFASIPLATSFVTERMQGSLLRLRILGISPALLLLSKALPYYLVNLAQMAVMLAIGVWLVPLCGGDRLDPGHSIAGLWLLGSATSVAAIGLALCIAVSVRTSLQATIGGGASSLLLAALGGVMVPRMIMPTTMQTLAQLSPMAWSLDGFWNLFVRGGGVAEVLPQAGALLLFGVLALAVAAALYRHTVHHNS